MPYVKTDSAVQEYTQFLPPGTPRKVRLYHFKHKLDHIPKCEFTGEDCWFSHTGYHGVNRYLFENLVQHDSHIKVEPIKYLNLLRAGAQPSELIALKNSKYFHKFRTDFDGCSTIEDFESRLDVMGFLQQSRQELLRDLRFDLWTSIREFIDRYYEVTKGIKNNHIKYYQVRGHSLQESTNLRHDVLSSWAKSLESKKTSDPLWYEMWCESRRRGLEAQAGRPSRLENDLFEALKLRHDVRTQQTIRLSKIDVQWRDLVKNALRCYVDMLVDGVFVEVNGSYWHHDEVKYPNMFSHGQYMSEIAKLKYIHLVTSQRVFVVWEYDVLSIEDIVTKIEQFIASSDEFGSTRQFDREIYEALP